jgi:enoyl-CoA hydratase/carnithine racemase
MTEDGRRVESDVLAAGGVRLHLDGALATVVLDRPDRRNAMSPSMWAALALVPELLPDETRVVLLRGEGPVFCAGLDLRMATAAGVPGETSLRDVVAGTHAEVDAWIAGLQRSYTWLWNPRWISIAAVQGPAVGAGFQLALAADLRVIADDARFCMRETALGLVPDLCGTATLHRIVGYPRALEICATARWVDAQEAMRIGLASAAAAPENLSAIARELCAAVLASNAAAVRAVKGLLVDADTRDVDAQRAAERSTQVPLLRTMAAGIT